MFFDRWLPAGKRRRAAISIGCDAGVLAECPVCRDITDTQQADKLPYAETMAQQLIAQNDERMRPFHGDYDAFQRELRKIIDESDVQCVCERI